MREIKRSTATSCTGMNLLFSSARNSVTLPPNYFCLTLVTVEVLFSRYMVYIVFKSWIIRLHMSEKRMHWAPWSVMWYDSDIGTTLLTIQIEISLSVSGMSLGLSVWKRFQVIAEWNLGVFFLKVIETVTVGKLQSELLSCSIETKYKVANNKETMVFLHSVIIFRYLHYF